MLEAFCDESGKHDSSPVFVLAGLRASQSTWKQLSSEWNRVLAAYDVSVFHATDCEARKKAFKGWTKLESGNLQKDLIELLGQYPLVGASLSVTRERHVQMMKPLDDVQGDTQFNQQMRQYKKTPYHFLLPSLVEGLLFHPHGRMKKSGVTFVFDRQGEFSGMAKTLFSSLRKADAFDGLLDSISFETKVNLPPLQMADLFTYECFRCLKDPNQKRWQGARLMRPMKDRSLLTMRVWNDDLTQRLVERWSKDLFEIPG